MQNSFPRITKTITYILIIHAIAFVLSIFLPFLNNILALYLSPTLTENISLLYRIFTYPLVGGYGNSIGLIFFALFMWWVGSTLEKMWGTIMFLRFYLTTISISGLLSMFLFYLIKMPLPVLGTTGITFAIIAVFAYNQPNTPFYIFGIFPLKAKWLVLIAVVLIFLNPSPVYILYNVIIQFFTGITAVVFVYLNFPRPPWLSSFLSRFR